MEGTIDADEQKGAVDKLRAQKLVVLEIAEKTESPIAKIKAALGLDGKGNVTSKDLVLFSRQLSTSSGGVCSATAIRALLREMIDAETPGQPLSDARLAEMLAEEGVRVARRTVTKYRRLMHLPNVELRRLS